MTTSAQRSTLRGDDLRHLLRRLVFSATATAERALDGRPAETVFDALMATASKASQPLPPAFAGRVWTNTALRAPGTTDKQYSVVRAAQSRSHQQEIEQLRQWWLGEMIAGASPLREILALFFQGIFGSTTSSVDMPQALYGCLAVLRGACLGTVPALLEQLVVDPAMMAQIGMDEHRKVRISDRPAKLMLDYWTVGSGNYTDRDVEQLSAALTGWTLMAPRGLEPSQPIDPQAMRAARRTGLVPVFDAREFDDRAKTILGTTRGFDARSVARFLGLHPATARRISHHLIRYLGVEDPRQRLEQRMVAGYRATGGSIPALLREIVRSDEFWSEESRWSLIKSPVHLAVGACRQLEMERPPLAGISRWLTASGQTLFDTPNGGEGGWPGQEAWMTPPARLVVRYQLPLVLGGQPLTLGVQPTSAPVAQAAPAFPVGAALVGAPAQALVARLDPAPGVDASELPRAADVIHRVMATPQYQLA